MTSTSTTLRFPPSSQPRPPTFFAITFIFLFKYAASFTLSTILPDLSTFLIHLVVPSSFFCVPPTTLIVTLIVHFLVFSKFTLHSIPGYSHNFGFFWSKFVFLLSIVIDARFIHNLNSSNFPLPPCLCFTPSTNCSQALTVWDFLLQCLPSTPSNQTR